MVQNNNSKKKIKRKLFAKKQLEYIKNIYSTRKVGEKQKKPIKYEFEFAKNKFKFLQEYIGRLVKRGNKASVEIGFVRILRALKKKRRKFVLLDYLTKAINEVRPAIQFISKKVGSITYQIPVILPVPKEVSKGIYWIIKETCGRKRGKYKKLIYKELVNLSLKRGNAVKVKRNLHQLARENKRFVKYLD